mgnify:FL=1
MTVEEIKNIIENAEFEYIGIRADSRDYKVGEVMDNSHQIFQDADCGGELVKEGPYAGFYDAGELDGTCALKVSEDNIEGAIAKAEAYGKKFYLIGGDAMEYGYDDGEIIIKEAEVIAIL